MNRNIVVSTYENNILLFKNHTTCIYEDDYIEFNTDNDNIRINLKTFSFTKENVESILKITKDKCLLTLKELKQSLEIPLEYVNFENSKEIILEYKLISQENPLKIILEIGDEQNEL
ncbi:MAG: hypothetical protein E7163_03960 [Firmicutes bacterium]|nr:hypothetical protein [Bacillota bacterium]